MGVADPTVSMEPKECADEMQAPPEVGGDSEMQVPPTGEEVEGEKEEEEEGAWNAAHKKYQEFQQACGDLLDPGTRIEYESCLKHTVTPSNKL